MALGSFLGGAGGSVLGRVMVQVGLDSTAVTKGLAKTQAELKTSGSSFAALGKGIGLAFGATAALGVAKFGAASVAAFMDSEAALNELSNALENNENIANGLTVAYEAQATALQNLTGFQDEEILRADAILARFELTQQQIKDTIPIVLDFARATGRDAASAAEAIGKAVLGNTRALKEVGVEYTRTGDRAADFTNILGLLEGQVGGSAEAFGETLSGQLAIAAAKFDDLAEQVGARLIPVLNTLLEALNDLAPLITTIFGAPEFDSQAYIQGIRQMIQQGLTPFQIEQEGAVAGNIELKYAIEAARREGIDWARAIEDGVYGLRKYAEGQVEAADATNDSTRAIKQNQLALLGLTDGFLGIKVQALQVAEAQKRVNELEKEGKKHTVEYDEAVLDLLLNGAALEETIRNYGRELSASGATAKEVKGKIRELGAQYGLTKGQVNELISEVNDLRDALTDTAGDYYATIHISTVGGIPAGVGGGIGGPGPGGQVESAGGRTFAPSGASKGGGVNVNVTINSSGNLDAAGISRHLARELAAAGVGS